MSAQTDVLCNGASTGSATVTASSGISPYCIRWKS
ncbi:SprB repeat-containing protein [Lacihabitans soyangensis]|nr:SprB repeat-containing protein [Lacihabitans soyangensis]